ncbi:MAG: isochorismatase family protein [Pyrinomonadaceae bacterium]
MRTSDYLGKITPDNAAVLLIDYQTQLILGCQSATPEEIKNNTLALAQIARMYELPVVITTTGGGAKSPAGGTISDLTKVFPDVEAIDRQQYLNSMQDPKFNEAVKATGRKKLIMGGITTDLCVVFPAITAVAEGYDVYVVADACAAWTKEIHEISLRRLTQAGVIVTNVQALCAELQTNLTEIDAERAKVKQKDVFNFYGTFVGPLSNAYDNFFSRPENKQMLESFK